MPIDITLDHEHRLLRATWHGRITAPDLAEHWARLFTEEALALGRSLVDLRRADLAFTGMELSAVLQSVVAPQLTGRRWAAALLVATPTQYGQARQFEAYAEEVSRTEIFHDEAAALAWLLAQPLPGQGPGGGGRA